jgi:streptogramin lyase
MIECNLIIDPPPVETSAGLALPGGGPLLEGGGEKGGFDPENLQAAYKIPTSGGSEETVALVDAYGYKSAESDLAKYREKYKLAACTKASGCFKQVNEKGEEKNYPAESGGLEVEWSLETSLDMDMISAACPNCKIMLVEATTQGPADTGASAEEAAKLKASEISNSYGYPENNETWCPSKNGCKEYLSDYNHAGIPVTVSSGDSGYDDGVGAPSWPATSPNIIAVGGTSLKKAEGSRGWSETVWGSSGSGCSLYEAKPTWQTDKGCTKRTDNDVAAVASPSTPVSVYNTPYAGGWINVGGTSVSSPFVAGVEAHATSATKKLAAEAFYKKPNMLFHISEGSNGSCGTESEATYYLCHATKEGYNGPTGWGTPDGVFSVTAAPSVTTEAATSITSTGATLNGTVNPEGLETKYYFEYGTSESYGTKTAEVSGGSGTSNIKESKAITGLTAGNKYYFRIVATNSDATTKGQSRTFTAENPPENTSLPMTSPITPDQAVPESTTTGTWTNGPTSYAYQWERCNATGGECTGISGATSATYTPVEADVAHTLVVKVTATNEAGANFVLSAATGKVEPIGQITEYYVGSGTPSAIASGPDGNTWFTLQGTAEIGKITTSGTLTRYAVPSGVRPFGITAGPEKEAAMWFIDEGTSKVGKITTSGTITQYALPAGSYPWSIVTGADGNIWFTEFGTSKVGKITPSGTMTEYTLPTSSDPSGITAGPDGNIWFTEWGTRNIAKITPSGTITEYSTGISGLGKITTGPDKNLWFIDYAGIGKMTASGTVTEYTLPSESEPTGVTAGADGNVWITEYGTSKVGRVTPSGTITEYSLPAKSAPEGIVTGPDSNVWFDDTGTHKVGKIVP